MDPSSAAQPTIQSIDGEVFTVERARVISKRSFACLPLLWAVNVWLFWHHFRTGADPVISKYTRYSAAGFVAVSAVFLPWMFTFMIGGPSVVGQSVYDKLDATGYNYLNLGSLG